MSNDDPVERRARGRLSSRIRASRPSDADAVVAVWRRSVDATHDFLSPEDRAAIDPEVCAFLPTLPLWVAVDRSDRPIGFMALTDASMDALFIDPDHRGTGVGRALVEFAFGFTRTLATEVNEQNGQAVGFYRRLGFRSVGRSPVDRQGRPYPLIFLRLDMRRR